MHAVTGTILSILLLSLPLTSIAQVPEPPPAVFGAGGGSSSAGAVFLSDTVGQSAVGPMTVQDGFHGAGFWYQIDLLRVGPANAVLIASFEAVLRAQGVELNWVIGSADGLVGFKIYRSEQPEAGFVPLNREDLLDPESTSFIDSEVRPDHSYWYQLGAVDSDGEFLSPVQMVLIPHREVELSQNYPNPFNPTTRIDYYLPVDDHVVLTVYGVRGDRVVTLVDEPVRYGSHSVVWNGLDERGVNVSSGVYFYRLQAGKRVITRKLVVMK